jgi:hypothetical protein
VVRVRGIVLHAANQCNNSVSVDFCHKIQGIAG